MTVVRDHDPPLWRTIVTSLTQETLATLEFRSTGRQFLFTLNAPASFRCQVAADDQVINLPWPNLDDPAKVTNNARLLYAFRRERTTDPLVYPWQCRFGGIIIPVEDEVADAPTSTLTAYDPWQYLMSRPCRYTAGDHAGNLLGENGVTYAAGTRASDIAVNLLTMTELEDGESHIDYSDAGLLDDTVPLDEPVVIEQATSVGEAWQQLCETGTIDIVLIPYYNPDSAVGKVCKLQISPLAGTLRPDAVLAWDKGPHSLVDLSRMVDRMANNVRFFPGGAAVQTHTQTDSGSESTYGEWWDQQIYNASTHPELIDILAEAEMLVRRYGQRTLTAHPVAEASRLLPLVDYGLGDYVPMWASRNLREPLGIDYDAYLSDPTQPGAAGYQRIYGIPVELNDDGVESVPGIITSQDSLSG